MTQKTIVKPQDGPQTSFIKCSADVVLFGGSAGGGKSAAMLLKPLQFVGNKDYRAIIFRRTYPEIEQEGGLLDFSRKWYTPLGAKNTDTRWTFPSGARISMSHMEHEKDRFKLDGAQVAHIFFDQVEMFTRAQVLYAFSRLRSDAGIRGRIFMSANPPKDKTGDWLLPTFLDWYIGDDGYAIPERSGVIRHFCMVNDKPIWGEKDDLDREHGESMSFCFIRSSVYDNKILIEKQPDYISKLKAMSCVDRERQLNGNWKIKEAQGLFFKKKWVQVITENELPDDLKIIRSWDLAATEKNETNNPDFTACVKLAQSKKTKRLIVLHAEKFRFSPARRDLRIRQLAEQDFKEHGSNFETTIPKDAGQAGVDQASRLVRELFSGFRCRALPANRQRGNKVRRFEPFSAQAEHGNVSILAGKWNDEFISELESFDGSDKNHDDMCLVRGTLITCIDGDKPIENLKKGDLVLTRKGFKKVKRSWMTGKSSDLYTLKTKTGKVLTGTGGHPIYIHDVGFVRMDAINDHVNVLTCESIKNQNILIPLFLMAYLLIVILIQSVCIMLGIIGLTLVTLKMVLVHCIEKFGNLLMVKYQKASIYIIKMGIRSIIQLKILNALKEKNIFAYILNVGTIIQNQKNKLNISKKLENLLSNGIHRLKVGNGIENMLFRFLIKKILLKKNAIHAVKNLKLNHLWQSYALKNVKNRLYTKIENIIKSSAHTAWKHLKQNQIESCFVAKNVGQEIVWVYNIEVSEENEYYANGILVHNCDAVSDAFFAFNVGQVVVDID